MPEAVINYVRLETMDFRGNPLPPEEIHPITMVYRVEFESDKDFQRIMDNMPHHTGVVSVEQLKA